MHCFCFCLILSQASPAPIVSGVNLVGACDRAVKANQGIRLYTATGNTLRECPGIAAINSRV